MLWLIKKIIKPFNKLVYWSDYYLYNVKMFINYFWCRELYRFIFYFNKKKCPQFSFKVHTHIHTYTDIDTNENRYDFAF